ncbi:MAG: M50 family metallopeptidase [Clostridiales bacterium]|nr:M50 family metallopeptidase [Clostridiales bacterium]
MHVIISMLIFGVIVLAHEWGHFIAARKNGVMVEEFAIGMGPILYSVKKGETLYSVRWLPIGGMCRMLGEDEESLDRRSFNSRPVIARIIIILAGAAMNLLLAYVLQLGLTAFQLTSTTVISQVIENSPASEAGLEAGDKILKYNNTKVNSFEDASYAIMYDNPEGSLITVQKPSGEIVTKAVTPKYNAQDSRYVIGITALQKASWFSSMAYTKEEHREIVNNLEKLTIPEFFSSSLNGMFFKVKLVLYGVRDLISLKLTPDDFMGPIGLVDTIGETYEVNLEQSGAAVAILRLVDITILISANLAVFNLLPFPALDGGRFLFLFIEALRGKPIDQKKEAVFHLVGIVILIGFSIFIAFNDAFRLIGK